MKKILTQRGTHNPILKYSFIIKMNHMHFLFLAIVLLIGSASPDPQRLEIVKFDALQSLITRDSDQIEVINFWATWCKPCIKELPYFQELHEEMTEINVTLISLDFAEQFQDRVVPFAKKRGLTPDILLLDEIDYNSWINKVDPNWSGAIPATLVINHKTGKRKFVESGMEKNEIELLIKEIADKN
ncbi:MAG: TlpA disulfide reductase family protein [Cyclobacteriaceae bacterium]